MSKTDPGALPTSKLDLAVTIINGSPIYPSRVSLQYCPQDFCIYHLLPTLLLSCKIASISNNSPLALTSLWF